MTHFQSRSEHRSAVRDAPLRINVVQKYRIETDIDIVGYFCGFTPAQQANYWATDVPDNCGSGPDSWGRPFDYLMEMLAEDVEVNEPLLASRVAISNIDEDDFEARVAARGSMHAPFNDRYWTENDFRALVAAVPWLLPERMKDEAILTRTPGPNDSPLWEQTETERGA